MKKNLFKKSLLSLIPLAIAVVPLASCANNNSVNNIGSNNQNNSGWRYFSICGTWCVRFKYKNWCEQLSKY